MIDEALYYLTDPDGDPVLRLYEMFLNTLGQLL